MAYTQAQLVAAYTAANNGVAPDAATQLLLGSFAAQNQAGQLTDAAVLAYVINSAQDDVQVAVQAYQFFTGKTPTKAGLDFLTNSAANTTDLNDPYYSQFNLENRYINFAANLGINGEGATAFAANYGALSFQQFVGVVYEQIIGSSYAQAAGINVSAAIADIISRQANFTNTALARGIITPTSTTAQRDLATKAAVVGYLMAEGVKADVGLYAAGANNFTNALISGTAVYNTSLTTTYSPLGGGVGQAVPGSGGAVGTGQLTVNPETISGNVFNAPQAYTPGGDDLVNTLQNDDFLTGVGADPTLNVTLGNPNDNGNTVITPTLRGVEIVNARFDATGTLGSPFSPGAGMTLDLQDAQATAVNGNVDTINITRIASNTSASVINIPESVATNLSVSNTQAPASTVTFAYLAQALAGAADKGNVTLSNVNIGSLVIQEGSAALTTAPDEGFEVLTVNSVGSANKVGTMYIEDVQTLNVTGDKNLTLGSTTTVAGSAGFLPGIVTPEATRYTAGLANVNGSLTKIDATGFKGNLDITLGSEFNAGADNTSGKNIQLSVIGGDGNDTFRLSDAVVAGAIGNTDSINGGAGTNTLSIIGSTTIAAAGTAAAPVATITNIQALEIRSGQDAGTGADAVSINADAFDKLATVYVRNEGQTLVGGVWTSAAEGLTTTLTNLTSAQLNGITVAHGTTGNNSLGNNLITATLKTATGAADTATVTIVDGINSDPVFNFSLSTATTEKVAFVDSDTESNSVFLAQNLGATASATVAAQAGSSITLTGGAAGQYFNLDTNQATNAAGVNAGYGYATNGSATSATTVAAAVAAIGGVPAAVSTSARDNTVSSVFFGAGQNGTTAGTKYAGEVLTAGAYLGDVVIRLGDVTKADGVSSQSLTTGVGNDTFIFDNTVTNTNAGFTSGDTITAGTGTDVLVLDGDATGAITPRIDTQTSEWDNVKGIDVLRFAHNGAVLNVGNTNTVAYTGGGYYAAIDNDFVSQTDAGNRLTVVNNDGRLDLNTESDLVLDLRGLAQNKWVTFVGANGVGNAGISSNRIVLDDVSANSNMVLAGGDTDVRAQTTGGYVAGNNNVLEIRNTANVSINDLSQMKDFGLINFSNDQAVAQTFNLTLNNTVVEALVDSSSTATSAATAETLFVTSTDNSGLGVASQLNVNATALTGFHYVNVQGSLLAANTIVGGAGNDTLTGGNANDQLSGNEGADSIVGGGGNDAINGGEGNDTLVGGFGADTITTGAGNDQVGTANNFGAFGQSVAASANTLTAGGIANGDTITFGANVDRVTDFVTGTDKLDVVNGSTAATTLMGVTTATDLATGTTYSLLGTFDAATNVFTVDSTATAATANVATLVVVGAAAVDTAVNTTGYVVLQGVSALASADFI